MWPILLAFSASAVPEATEPYDLPDAPIAVAYGDETCGALEGGEALPCWGDNFEAFTGFACRFGRNYLHPVARDLLLATFEEMSVAHPEIYWTYGEMSRAEGGPLWPHLTHQNGLSLDIFLPVVLDDGSPAMLATKICDAFGYGLELDADGRLGAVTVDFGALGDLLLAIDGAARARGARIARVVITPDYHARMFAARPALERLWPTFLKKESWVRHDEHVHVEIEPGARFRRSLTCSDE